MSSKAPTPFGGAGGTPETKDYRARLVAFYKKHNPSKVDTVDATLAKYQGKEEEMFLRLQAKYEGTKPASPFPLPSGEGPQCYLEFAVDGEKAGRVVVKLYEDKVPLASDNFKCLCTGEKGMGRLGKPLCYKGSKVHRIVPNFCVQFGDFTKGDGRGGESIYPPNSQHGDAWGKFKDEAFMQHSKPGLLSMANSGKNTNSSQVFLTLRPVTYLDGKHVVFGEVVDGLDVVETLGQLETNAKQNPVKVVTISECGEIVDGKDVPSQIPQSTPFGIASSGFGPATTPSFGTPGQSPFGTSSAAGLIGFGNNSTPSERSFAFGKTTAPSFGSLSLDASKSSPFSFGATNASGGSSSSAPSTFSFGNSDAGPSFGSLSLQSQKQPFSFNNNQ
jgi:cyclophilin family peptidyl-prolyl cis-trans isomerase